MMKLACVPYQGDDYLLVLDEANRVVPPDQVSKLARRRVARAEPMRRMGFVAVDESQPATRGGNAPLHVRGLDWSQSVPLELDCGGFAHPIGMIEALALKAPGTMLGTKGWHLVGVARFFRSTLADLAWAALPHGLIGICVRVNLDTTGHEGWLTAVRLDYPQRVCLAGARVLSSWED